MTALVVRVQNLIASLRDREEGQTMAEYALILGLIAVFVILMIFFLGGEIREHLRADGQLGPGGAGRAVGIASLTAAVDRVSRGPIAAAVDISWSARKGLEECAVCADHPVRYRKSRRVPVRAASCGVPRGGGLP